MAYTIPDMLLIPQTKTMACWYASAQMLVFWRRNRVRMTELGLMDPSEDPVIAQMRDRDHGVSNSSLIHIAHKLGLQPVPPMSPTEGAIENWLRTYGPLWVNGKTHIVVIAGIRPGEVYVYDPAPVNTGSQGWRSLAGWYVGGSVDSRDASRDVQAVFLHCPSVPRSKRPARTHIVKKGESLWKLAQIYYNDGALWPFIHAANRGTVPNPNLIQIGQKLIIP